MTTNPTLAERVAEGIEVLNEHGPDGWLDRVDLDILSFPSLRTCVLGQVYGTPTGNGFDLGMEALRRSLDIGFSGPFPVGTAFGFISAGEGYPALEAEWKRQLSALKEAS